MPHSISRQSYGKCDVNLTQVSRDKNRHSIIELTADIELDGDFEASYVAGDNRLVIPTDTMKNTVYALAKQRGVACLESFGQILVKHFVDSFQHVSRAMARLSEQPWRRISVDGSEHPHAFIGGGSLRHIATVSSDRSSLEITSGLDGLTVLKTTGSGFSGFLKDQYTTLQKTDDRIFATTISSKWDYREQNADWTHCRQVVRETLLEVFATHESHSVQQTLYAMASAVLEACAALKSITLNLPNQHRLLADLKPFGLDNENEIFVPTSEPYGVISATVERGSDGLDPNSGKC